MAACAAVPAAILRDAVLRTAPQDEDCRWFTRSQDEGRGVNAMFDMIGFMESMG
jgi:hypothetical protein